MKILELSELELENMDEYERFRALEKEAQRREDSKLLFPLKVSELEPLKKAYVKWGKTFDYTWNRLQEFVNPFLFARSKVISDKTQRWDFMD